MKVEPGHTTYTVNDVDGMDFEVTRDDFTGEYVYNLRGFTSTSDLDNQAVAGQKAIEAVERFIEEGGGGGNE